MQTTINLWQIEIVPWRPDINLSKVLDFLRETKDWTFSVLPEMAIPWYMIWDKWQSKTFVKECSGANERVLEILASKWSSAVWWNVDYDETKKNNDWSMRKYNTAFVWANWKLLWARHKTLMPNYRMFDDKRYFTSLEELAREEWIPLEEFYKPFEIEIDGVRQKVWVLICEDIWNINSDYSVDPVELTKRFNPDILAVSSCSPFWLNKDIFRKKLLEKQSAWVRLVYVNPIWTQNNWKNIFAFDWGSAEYEDWEFVRWTQDFSSNQVIESVEQKNEMQQIFETLIYAIKNFFEKLWNKKAIIWLSWWIDSWVVAALLTIALWAENVTAVNMPSKFNTQTTKDLAFTLATNLWIDYKVFPIQEAVELKVAQLSQVTWKSPTSFEIENIQARERWQILSDISANLGWIFTCNWNKDEIALWYATLYWDTSWAIAPIWDLHKYQVFELARFINEKFWFEVIPEKMIDMKPTAELSDEQNPEKWWWDPFNYEFVWRLIKLFTEKKYTPTDILRFYKAWELEKILWLQIKLSDIFENDEAFVNELEKMWKLMHRSYFKRVQTPPILTISKSSFGFDFRESQIEAYFWEQYERLKKEILKEIELVS